MSKTAFIDMTEKKFGRWTALYRLPDKPMYWMCVCDCGTKREVNARNMRRGQTKSCGCWNSESAKNKLTTHGGSGTRAYSTWLGMKGRCLNKTDKRFAEYGGRGIKISPLWASSFKSFHDEMGDPPPGYWIERIDNDGNYEPGNCKWATRQAQSKNKRNTAKIKAFGREMIQADWAKTLNTRSQHISWALKMGHTVEWLAKRRGFIESDFAEVTHAT